MGMRCVWYSVLYISPFYFFLYRLTYLNDRLLKIDIYQVFPVLISPLLYNFLCLS